MPYAAYTAYTDSPAELSSSTCGVCLLTPVKPSACKNDYSTGHTRRCVIANWRHRSGDLVLRAALEFEFKEGFFVQVTPDDASLLCALGDITLDDKHYQTAWDVSNGHSTRAQRSLARSAQRQQHWVEVRRFTMLLLMTTHGHPLFPSSENQAPSGGLRTSTMQL